MEDEEWYHGRAIYGNGEVAASVARCCQVKWAVKSQCGVVRGEV